MKFIDEAIIEAHAGKGGDGAAAFRRERFVPRGGPSGGDGGRGGSIWAVANRNINTLIDYRYARIHRAGNGEAGSGSDKYGRGGNDLVLRVPVGTIVRDEESGEVIADLADIEHREEAHRASGATDANRNGKGEYAPLGAVVVAHALWRHHRVRSLASVLVPCTVSAVGLLLYHQALYGFWDPRRVYGRSPELALANLPEGLQGLFLDQEFGLLAYFLQNPERVLTRETLLSEVWHTDYLTHRTIDNFVGRLRAKFEPDPDRPRYFLTVRGVGYRFEPSGKGE